MRDSVLPLTLVLPAEWRELSCFRWWNWGGNGGLFVVDSAPAVARFGRKTTVNIATKTNSGVCRWRSASSGIETLRLVVVADDCKGRAGLDGVADLHREQADRLAASDYRLTADMMLAQYASIMSKAESHTDLDAAGAMAHRVHQPELGRRAALSHSSAAYPFEHRPTGIYVAFARNNIHSIGLRVSARPVSSVELGTSYRPYWPARWGMLPGNLRFEAGGSYLFAGEFIKNAPNAAWHDNPAYGDVSMELTF